MPGEIKEKIMHIVYVTTEFVLDQHCGGLASYIANMATIFTNNRHKVSVIVVTDDSKKATRWADNVTVDYIDFNRFPLMASIKKKVYESNEETSIIDFYYKYRGLIIRKKIKELNKRDKIDIVQYCNLLAVGLYPVSNIPYIIRMSSYPGMPRLASKIDFDVKNINNELNRMDKLDLKIIKKSKEVISPSNYTADIVKRSIGKKIRVIESPFYINMQNWDYNTYSGTLLDKKYLLFYGRLSREKGLHVIDEIIYKILDKYRDLHFVFIGSDHGMMTEINRKMKVIKKLKISAKEYEDRIIYYGPMIKEKLFPIIQNAVACVLPSITDNLPNTCIESMALGKIVIGSKEASFDQLIIDNYSGFLCENGSAESLYEKIEQCMKLTEDQKYDMSNNAKLRIDKLNPEEVYNNYLRYYKHVIKSYKYKY